MPNINDRLMFCGERIDQAGNRSRVIAGYLEVERSTGRIMNGRYIDSSDNIFRVKPNGSYDRNKLRFTIVSDSGWSVDFEARRKSGYEYFGKVDGPKYGGSVHLKVKSCMKDIHGREW